MARRPTRKQIRRIGALLDPYSERVRAGFLSSIREVQSGAQLSLIIERLTNDDIGGAVRALNIEPAAFADLSNAIEDAFNEAGRETARSIGSLPEPNSDAVARVRFDGRNPTAEALLSQLSTEKVVEVVDEQRALMREVLRAGMERGDNPRDVALDFVGRIDRATGRRTGGFIGLAENQAQFVRDAELELRDSDPASLRKFMKRALRDKRYDRTIERAIRTETSLDKDTVRRAISSYKNSWLRLRAETIGRTETLSAIHSAQQETFRQQVEAGRVTEQQVRRIWRTASDSRVRDSHSDMEGQSVGLNEPFTSGNFVRLMRPGDPGAPADEVINCRCTVEYRIDFLANIR